LWCSEACAPAVRGEEPILTGSFLFGEEFDPVAEVSVLGPDLRAGPFRIRVVPTPGHSMGSICLFDERTGALFPGDLVFCDGGVGRWDLPGGDLSVLRDSVRTVMGLDVRGLFPGHGRIETKDPMGEIHLAASSLDMV
jgi:glyoxylase-like metal-dependent hydrolase (beta-lactamase superfamily II)